MKKIISGIFLSALLLPLLCSCGKDDKPNSKLLLNEVLVDNQSNFQDDYGIHSAWVEIFNKSYGSADLAGYYLAHYSSAQGDTAYYFIPKGDVLTLVKPRQHALFWADAEPRRGTFHTNFKFDINVDNWIGLYDAGKKLMDQIVVPAGLLQANQSYARVSDAAVRWEVKGNSEHSYVTPSTNNKTMDSNAKMEKFAQHDGDGIGMAISAMSVVFFGLLALFVSFKIVGGIATRLHRSHFRRAKEIVKSHLIEKLNHEKAQEEAERKERVENGEIQAAIALALHEMLDEAHDTETMVLTINPMKGSAWNAKTNTLREMPKR